MFKATRNLHVYKEWKEAKETKEMENALGKPKNLKEHACVWRVILLDEENKRAWLDEYKHWCCGEAQWYK